MKSILAVAVLTGLSLVVGQARDKSNKQTGSVEQALMRIEQGIDDAVVAPLNSLLPK